MSWQIEIPLMVRILINDWDANPTYSDDRISQMVVVAAKYVQMDVVLDHTYTVDVSSLSITPDPTLDTRDDIFISFLSLKTACMIDQSTFRTKAAMEGVRAALGPANLAVSGSLSGWKTILDMGPCAAYSELAASWNVKDASAVRGILGPFVGNKFDPRYLLRGPIRDRTNSDFYS
jgi:hypothetical protein